MKVSKLISPPLDAWLTPAECAAWLRITPRQLAEKSVGREPVIPSFRVSRKAVRYHPRTIICRMAKSNNVPFDALLASMAMEAKK